MNIWDDKRNTETPSRLNKERRLEFYKVMSVSTLSYGSETSQEY